MDAHVHLAWQHGIMAHGDTFISGATRRIANTVRRVEQMPRKLDPGPIRNRGPVPYLFRRFELKESLTSGGHAPAHPVLYDDDADDWAADTDETKEFEVYDFLGEWSGDGRDGTTDPVTDGARGYAIKMHDFADLEILIMECP